MRTLDILRELCTSFVDICFLFFVNAGIFNVATLVESKFPNLMKIAEITPVFKKLDNTSKDNYRPMSTLSSFT